MAVDVGEYLVEDNTNEAANEHGWHHDRRQAVVKGDRILLRVLLVNCYNKSCYRAGQDREATEGGRFFKFEEEGQLDEQDDNASAADATHSSKGHDDHEHHSADAIHHAEVRKELFVMAVTIFLEYALIQANERGIFPWSKFIWIRCA